MKLLQTDQRTVNPDLRVGYDETITDRDMAFTLLSSRRRRNVIHALTNDGDTTVSELSRQLAAWETGKPPQEVSSKERKRTYTALRQTHLPRLAKHGVVAYDANRGTVALTERGEALRPYLHAPEDSVSALFITAVTAVLTATVVLSLSWAGISPFTMLTGYQLAAVSIGAFALVTVAAYVRLGPRLGYERAYEADTNCDGEDSQLDHSA